MEEFNWLFSFLIAFILGTFGSSLLLALLNILSGKIMGLDVWKFRTLFWEVNREMVPDGKCHVRTNRFKLMSTVMMGKIDESGKSCITKKQDQGMVIISIISYLLIVVGFSIFALALTGGISFYRLSFGKMIVRESWYVVVVYAIMYVLVTLKVIKSMKSGILGLYNQKIREMRAMGKISTLYLPPLEQLNLSGTDYEKGQYQNLRLMQAIHMGDMRTMFKIAVWFEEKYSSSVAGIEWLCVNIIFYYAYYCQNYPSAVELARKHFDKVKVELQKGVDSNDKRIYAYYMYYVEHNANEAYRLAHEGLQLLPKYPRDIPELWEGEQKWLNHLLEEIQRNTGATPYSI